jgi:DDB1- and CUL4-associated factor 13
MKVKTISRATEDYTRDRRTDVDRLERNRSADVHPFEQAREYTRALQATKLQKMFSKPFVAAMDDHTDGVWCTAVNPKSLTHFVSGACDGEVRVWDLSLQKSIWHGRVHQGFVRGVTVSRDGEFYFTCGDDKLIKQWRMHDPAFQVAASSAGSSAPSAPDAVETWRGDTSFSSIDHCWQSPQFATSNSNVQVWDYTRSQPVHEFKWGCDSVYGVRYNPAEPTLIAAASSDRNIILYDIRLATAVRKTVLRMKTNKIAWNPREPMNFACANEDHCCYSFDMRKLDKARVIHKDHVGAVMDVAFSPTGQEIVTGSYDRTIRLFKTQSGKSHEVYHTRRMQRLFTVNFSSDSKYIISGSDDANVRIWKARADLQLGKMAPRQRRKQNYAEELKNRYIHTKEIRRIAKHRHVPKLIMKQGIQAREENQRTREKRKRVEVHSKEGAVTKERERKKVVVREFE